MPYSRLSDPQIAPGAPGKMLPQMRANGIALKAQAALGHVAAEASITHGANAFSLLGGWSPAGMSVLVDAVNVAMVGGDTLYDLEAPAALGETYGGVFLPFLSWVDGEADEYVTIPGLRVTPTMIKMWVLDGHDTTGNPPSGHYNLKVYRLPVDGQSVPAVTGFVTILDPEMQFKSYITDALLAKMRACDDNLNEMFLAEHDNLGVHVMGLRHLNAERILTRQAIAADPAGPARQTFPADWRRTGFTFLEIFSDGAGDTELDIRLGASGAYGETPILVADLAAGGTVTTNYEVSIWVLN